MSYGLVYWVKDNKTSIVNIDAIPEENRIPGHIAQVLWADQNRYAALVIKIGKRKHNLEMADEKFLANLNSLKASEAQSKRSRKKSSKAVENELSARDVAFAVGEKPKIPTEQEDLQRALKLMDRSRNHNAKTANIEESSSLLLTKRKLFGQQPKSPLVTASHSPLEFSNRVNTGEKEIEDDQLKSIEQSSESDNSDSHLDSSSEDEEIGNKNIGNTTPKTPDDRSSSTTPARKEMNCVNCEELAMKANRVTLDFVKTLFTFVRQNSADSSQTLDGDNDANVMGPVLTTPGQTKVELKRGCGVWLRNSTKAKLLLECENDPYKLTRKLLPEVFGDRIKRPGFTALGQGKDKIGLDDTALKGIYDFVRRNCNVEDPPGSNRKGEKKKPFSYKVFVMEVNRKLGSSRRDRSKEKQKASKGSSKSRVKTPKKQERTTPQKNTSSDSPSKEGRTWRVTPIKKGPEETRATVRNVPPATSTTSNQINRAQGRASDQEPNAPSSYKQDGQQPGSTDHLPYTHQSSAAVPHTAPLHATPSSHAIPLHATPSHATPSHAAPLHAAPHAAAFHSAPFHAPAQPMHYNMGQGYFYDAQRPGPSHTPYSQHSFQGGAGSQQDNHNSFFPRDYLFEDDPTGTGNSLTTL